MVRDENLEKLLHRLADTTAEPVRRGLGEDIKRRIPCRLAPYKGGMDAINIIINLRISKLTAAAAIITTVLFCATFLSRGDSIDGGLYQDYVVWIKSYLGWGPADESQNGDLAQQVREFVYYGDSIDPENTYALLAHWKLPKGKYRVIFADFGTKIVGAEELVGLQSRMLLKKTK